jgi:hypothetical protein
MLIDTRWVCSLLVAATICVGGSARGADTDQSNGSGQSPTARSNDVKQTSNESDQIEKLKAEINAKKLTFTVGITGASGLKQLGGFREPANIAEIAAHQHVFATKCETLEAPAESMFLSLNPELRSTLGRSGSVAKLVEK